MKKVGILCALFLFPFALSGCEKKKGPATDESAAAEEKAPADEQAEKPAVGKKASPGGSPLPKQKLPEVTGDGKLGTVTKGFGLEIGTELPAVDLMDMDGKTVALKKLPAPIVVVFYRGGWCPFCNGQLRQLANNYDKFKAKGASLVAISVDKPDQASKTKAQWTIPFPVLSDSDLKAHKAFSVSIVPDAEYLKKLEGYGIDLSNYSGKDHKTIGVPSVFIFDKNRKLKWRHVDVDYKVRPSVDQILTALSKT